MMAVYRGARNSACRRTDIVAELLSAVGPQGCATTALSAGILGAVPPQAPKPFSRGQFRTVKVISWNIARRSQCLEAPARDACRRRAAAGGGGAAAGDRRTCRSESRTLVYGQRRLRSPAGMAHGGGEAHGSRSSGVGSKPRRLTDAGSGEFVVSRLGTLAAAHVTLPDRVPFVYVSMYSPWETPHASTESSWIVSDASARRVVPPMQSSA